jgi:hypothetical protein
VSAVYVCLAEDARSLVAALALHQRTREHLAETVPIVVSTSGEGGLPSLARGVGTLHPFSVLDRTCRAELLLSGTRNEILARAMHAEYVRKQSADGQTPATNPSMVGWDELPESLRESNRRQADHIGLKLKTIGCALAPRVDWRAPLLELAPEEVELLARLEHDRWRAERLLDGWTYAAGPKDLTRKTSPFLVPWEQIPEGQRDYDRNTVRNLPPSSPRPASACTAWTRRRAALSAPHDPTLNSWRSAGVRVRVTRERASRRSSSIEPQVS